jgi:GT2 family glycosyltransferase/glycosyltransferase involved in cell wall biosynthesis
MRGALQSLFADELAPLFWPAERLGTASAWWQHVPFAQWLIYVSRPRLLVELGSHGGVSYAALCNAVKRVDSDARCFAVDTWQGDEQAGFYDESVFESLRQFHAARFASFSQLLRCTFDEARERFEDGSIDLLHIDGLHTYKSVRHDFENWRATLSDRAIVLFHDTNERQANFGVWRLWAELRQQYPSFEFLHGHGLGVLCVGTKAPDELRHLCELPPHEAAVLRQRIAMFGERWDYANQVSVAEADAALSQAALSKACAEVERWSEDARDAREATNSAQQQVAELAHKADAADRRVAELTRQADATKQTIAELIREADAAKQRAVELTHEADAAKQTIAELIREADAAKQAVVELTRKAAEMGPRLADVTQELHVTKLQLDSLLNSTAWLVTFPLRQVGARIPARLRRHGRRALRALWWAAAPLRYATQAVAIEPSPSAPLPLSADNRLALVGPPSGSPGAASLWYNPAAPRVSIIVLNWNRSGMTLRCLEYIWSNTTAHHYEIIVVDNGSRPEELEQLRNALPRVRIVSLGVNRYFGEANNIGAEEARGEYLAFLNNDAFVHEGWLDALMCALAELPEAGAVGPRFLYPDGRLQEAGAMVSAAGIAQQLGKFDDGDSPAHDSPRVVDYVSAACVLMRHADFTQILGFDLMFDPAYYEDVDLCLKLRLLGRRTYYCPNARVTHVENATSTDPSHQLNGIVELNKQKFVLRWKYYLEGIKTLPTDLLPRASSIAQTNPTRGPRVLLYTPYDLTPGGGERYLLSIADALRGRAQVSLITPKRYSRLRLLTMGRELGLDLTELSQMSLEQARETDADLSFVMGNEIYPSVEGLARHNLFVCQFPFPVDDRAYLARVSPFIKDYSKVICYSSYVEKQILMQASAHRSLNIPVEVLTPPVPLYPLSSDKQARILHVGRFFVGGHAKRQDLLIRAFTTLVRDEGLQAELHLVGSLQPGPEHRAYYESLVETAAGLPIHFHVNCGPDDLAELYRSSRVYWHATGFGVDLQNQPEKAEHFGISVLEAMSAGCVPVVFAAGGPAEVVRDSETGFLFSSDYKLCARTMELMGSHGTKLAARMGQAASESAQAYGSEIFAARVRTLVDQLLSN